MKAFSSELAFRVADDNTFRSALADIRAGIDRVRSAFDVALSYVDLPDEIAQLGGAACMAEEAVSGQQATVEGFHDGTTAHVYGTIEAHNYDNTPSFHYYLYPSRLPEDVVGRLSDISRCVIEHIGLTGHDHRSLRAPRGRHRPRPADHHGRFRRRCAHPRASAPALRAGAASTGQPRAHLPVVGRHDAGPAVPALDRRDPYLSTPGLLEAGRMYAGDLDTADPLISPLNGSFARLGRISVFTGTRDVLLSDARRLRQIASREGIDIDYVEYQYMFHGWVLMQGLPEARQATAMLSDLLRASVLVLASVPEFHSMIRVPQICAALMR